MGRNKLEISGEQKSIVLEKYSDGLARYLIRRDTGLSDWVIRRLIQEGGQRLRSRSESGQRYEIDRRFFKDIDTEEKAYVLGLFYADGNVYRKNGHCASISLHEDDKPLLDRVRMSLKTDRPLTPRRKYHQWRLRIDNKDICDDLSAHGCMPAKSLTCTAPVGVPSSILHHFIRGYFDGDGSVWKMENDKFISTQLGIEILGSHDFTQWLAGILLKSLNIKVRPVQKGNIWSLRFNGMKQIKRFSRWLYKEATICLPRKRERFEKAGI